MQESQTFQCLQSILQYILIENNSAMTEQIRIAGKLASRELHYRHKTIHKKPQKSLCSQNV